MLNWAVEAKRIADRIAELNSKTKKELEKEFELYLRTEFIKHKVVENCPVSTQAVFVGANKISVGLDVSLPTPKVIKRFLRLK